MKSKEELLNLLKEICARQVEDVDFSNLNPNDQLKELEIDSLDFIEIIFQVEDNLGVNIPDTELKGMNTVDDILTGLQNLLEEKEKQAV